MEYRLVRSKRKYLALQIARDATLVVRAPLKMPVSDIERFVRLKQSWIQKHQGRQLMKKVEPKRFVAGERFWFLGKECPLEIVEGYASKLSFGREGGPVFTLSKFQVKFAKKKFEDWYREQSKGILSQKCRELAVPMGVSFKKITITGAETRWGSCSSRGTINFSWKLIMAPEQVINYVVIHELAHLKYHDHSNNFWNFVKEFDANYKKNRQWLHENEHQYRL